MKDHLNEAQIIAWVQGEAGPEVAQHLRDCDLCAGESEQLRLTLQTFAEAARAAAVQSECFWTRQRHVIMQRADGLRRVNAVRWALASATALIVVAVLLLLPGAPSEHRRAAVQLDADDVLLYQVQTAIQREVPAALAPVSLITAERNRLARARIQQASSQGESR